MIWQFPSISKYRIVLLVAACAMHTTCKSGTSSSRAGDTSSDGTMSGAIDYPFAEETKSMGRDGPSDRLVIKSTVGQTEYEISIPGAARDYDVEVPLSDLRRVGATGTSLEPELDGNVRPQSTDQEFVKNMPKLEDPNDRALVEGAFGLGETEGPRQSPSYTLRINKINRYYLSHQYELALIEINELLAYYPTASKLYKMKGTILVKTRNLAMAEIAWARALELTPNDQPLRLAIEALRNRMLSHAAPTTNNTDAAAASTPTAPK